LFKELQKIKGVKPYPSQANFILFRVKNSDAVWEKLISRYGILIRNLSPEIKDGLRVTVGRPEENKSFLSALRTIQNENPGEN
jgi:histidinol-phosphate aminotransferase